MPNGAHLEHNQAWTVPRKASFLTKLRTEIYGFSKSANLPEQIAQRMVLCVDEAAANIVEHAKGGRGNSAPTSFQVSALYDNKTLKVILSDAGAPFNPTKQLKKLNIQNHTKQGNKDGLGLYILKRVLDIFEYRYDHGKNICTMGIRVAKAS